MVGAGRSIRDNLLLERNMLQFFVGHRSIFTIGAFVQNIKYRWRDE